MIHLVYELSVSYWFSALVSIVSASRLLSRQCEMTVYVLSFGLPEDVRAIMSRETQSVNPRVGLEFIEITETDYLDYPAYHGSRILWSKVELEEILSNVKWVLRVDSDTLWYRSPEEVWQFRDDTMEVVGSRDLAGKYPEYQTKWFEEHHLTMSWDHYFCAGFFLINLEALRNMGFRNRVREFLRQYGAPVFVEQDAFNILCERKKFLPKEWGVFARRGYLGECHYKDLGCVHYVLDLPWRERGKIAPITDIVNDWWRAAMKLKHIMPESFRRYHRSPMFMLHRTLFCLWKGIPLLRKWKWFDVRLRTEIPQQ